MDTTRYRKAETRLFDAAGIRPAEHRVPLRRIGGEARVLEVGEGPPVLFLTGGPDAAATWAYVAADVQGLRCLLLDRPGTGLSEPPATIPDAATLPGYLSTLTADVLDGLGVERASLVGCSLGGCAALRSAAVLTERVDRVVLAGAPAFVPGWRAPSFFTLLRVPLLGPLVARAPATRASVRLALRQMGHRRALRDGRIPAPMLDWIRAWMRDTPTMRSDAAMIRACGSLLGGFAPHLDLTPDELGAVRAPCHLLLGSDDPVGNETVGRGLVAALSQGSIDVMPGAGHLPWLDDPAHVAGAITSFLGRRQATTPAMG